MSVWGNGSTPRFDSLASAPTASAYGVGPAWINGRQYWSNGVTWEDAVSKYSLSNPKNNRVVMFGDSLARYSFFTTTCTSGTTIIVDANGLCTIDAGTLIEGGPGTEFTLDRTNNPALNFCLCTIVSKLTANSCTFTVSGYTPPAGTITEESGQSIIMIFANKRTVLSFIDYASGLLGGYFLVDRSFARAGGSASYLKPLFETLVPTMDQGWCVVWAGTNDLNTTNTTAAADAIYDNIIGVATAALNRGMCVVLVTLPPFTTAAFSTSTAQRYQAIYINNRLRTWSSANRSSVILLDAGKILADATSANGAYQANFTIDGIHFSARGAVRLGTELATLLAPFTGTWKVGSSVSNRYALISQDDSYSAFSTAGFGSFARQVLRNTALAGTSGTSGTGITGSTPTNWSTARGGACTATISSDVNAAGTCYEVTAAVTATANNDEFQFYQSNTGLTAFAGKKATYGVTVEVESPVNLKSLLVQYQQTINNATSGTTTLVADMINTAIVSSSTGLLDQPVGKFTFTNTVVLQNHTGNANLMIKAVFWGAGGCTMKISEPFCVIN